MSLVVTVQNHAPDIAAALPRAVEDLITRTAFAVQREWMTRAPVDTGTYRRSITTERQGPTMARVYSPLDYAVYLEYGTRSMSPRPSMTPAVEAVRPAWEQGTKALFGRGEGSG